MTGTASGTGSGTGSRSEYGGDEADRAERLRAGFQSQGAPGVTADAERQLRQKRLIYTVIGTLFAVLGLVLIVVRLMRGDGAGAWLGFYGAGAVVAALGALLARRASPRWAFAVIVIGGAVMGLGDQVGH
ncbi:hypothetical protein ABZW18_20325 [Streptomyces sp. NPDC004647]|uniref:hypothetical protein n=1 Tax=Streptomyces sp. NPDC004647 TaxID=3154671 RepID=UPI0033BD256A